MGRILFVFTSCSKTLTGGNTGWYLPEAAHPYYVLEKHHTIDFAAPNGPNPPVDENSVHMFKDDESQQFLKDETVVKKFAEAKKLSEVAASQYDAIFYVGGHGPVIDLASDRENIKLANQFWRSGKITSAVCHGPAALVGVTDEAGNSIFKGRAATSFTNEEEIKVDAVKAIPFLVEDRLKSLGAKFEKTEPFGAKVIVDGKLITGQNPASAKGVGEAIQAAL
ncbi:class I glutamine amidotransferase-like protein, partial [Daedalea quercina L-15889]